MNKYEIIYTDPPWPQKKAGLRQCRPKQGRELDYQTASVEEIFELHKPFLNAADEKHNVFVWTIDKFLPVAEEEMRKLGYELHARLVWDKTNGIAPAFTVRFSHEYLLWFYKRGKMLMPRKEVQICRRWLSLRLKQTLLSKRDMESQLSISQQLRAEYVYLTNDSFTKRD